MNNPLNDIKTVLLAIFWLLVLVFVAAPLFKSAVIGTAQVIRQNAAELDAQMRQHYRVPASGVAHSYYDYSTTEQYDDYWVLPKQLPSECARFGVWYKVEACISEKYARMVHIRTYRENKHKYKNPDQVFCREVKSPTDRFWFAWCAAGQEIDKEVL